MVTRAVNVITRSNREVLLEKDLLEREERIETLQEEIENQKQGAEDQERVDIGSSRGKNVQQTLQQIIRRYKTEIEKSAKYYPD
ncbi:hypothetical protein HHI36_008190 [Cryptolaemus montrouzieri]|uniref:Uncharacterized protein n=1 Tax=Cryptolaemus montrouzieri TaxID=559131 RepID=A0ABD2MS06_9CUCU